MLLRDCEIGMAVRLLVTASDDPSGESPGGVYARPGEKLIIKRVGPPTFTYPVAVHHEIVTDGSAFAVKAEEIEPWEPGHADQA